MTKILTFLEYICCNENPAVDTRAHIIPMPSYDSSVMVAIVTPVMMGTRLKYTLFVCFSPIINLDRITVKSGIVALTVKERSQVRCYITKVRLYLTRLIVYLYRTDFVTSNIEETVCKSI